MQDFTCLSVTPAELEHPGLAVATARAGGVGVLDREFCRDADLPRAHDNLTRLLELTGEAASVGLRLRADQSASSRALLELLGGRRHWLILCGWDADSLASQLASLPRAEPRTLLLEVTGAAEAAAAAGAAEVQGLLARGSESGGWVGDDPAFILTQKLVAARRLPVYVQGGIGLHTAAACKAIGAAGVVLDDQLLLMPESPLSPAWGSLLGHLGGHETVVAGERLGAACRFLARPGMRAAAELQQEAERAELECGEVESAGPASSTGSAAARWRERARASLGWGPPESRALPLGQAAGMAARLREKYGTTGRLVRAVLDSAARSVALARRLRPLSPDGALAASHGTRYPIVQGPMTRVSDTAEFAAAVARAGALPLVALALMKRDEAGALLRQTNELLAGRPWGVGILGFVPQELREQQIKAVREVVPPFALIAGGRPDQAAQLEALGIATYIHVPTVGLLESFLAKGARRFVFEGRECGGHVGPLTSFALWEGVVAALLERVAPNEAASVHVLFAGGIHDAASAAMVSAMAAPLAERGMRVGVLMGTAYLYTKEAVAHGAIVKTFQEQALACDRTTNLETGPGHAIRCVSTPFSREFYAARRRAVLSGASPSQLKEALESLTVGRLRLASKGVERDGAGRLSAAGAAEQLSRGIYMIGQVATMRDSVCGMEELHADVSVASAELLRDDGEAGRAGARAEGPADIAIVGVGLILPGAQHPSDFWENLLRKVNTITEIPAGRWDWRLFFDPDRKASDKIYSRWGGFIDEVPFDPLRFGIPPNSLKSISCTQLLTLEVVRRALEDAGYESGDFDREHTSVVLASAEGGGAMYNALIARTMLPLLIESAPEQVMQRLPEWTGETFPGALVNVTAGRVANRFDFGGANFTVDAACASSLAAIDIAVAGLESGRCNVAIAGGADFSQSPFFYVAFSKTQALSPRGRARTFDQSADGIVISEGAAVLVLKRLADAERDGDRIYAVIKGVASSSDGKALGLTAPRPVGQMRAVERAKRKAGVGLDTVGLYEAHGTGTVVGDQAELETIVSSLKADGAPGDACAIGSIKTLVGHTKMAAGVVGLTKAALSLYHKALPPHFGVERPLDPISQPDSPVYLLNETRPWLAHPEHPRRAAVSAFGFGGTNTHAILEEYRGEVRRRAAGADAWPFELVAFSAESEAGLREQARRLIEAIEAGARPRLRDLAYSCAVAARAKDGAARMCVVAESVERLREDLAHALDALGGGRRERLPQNVIISDADSGGAAVAALFPGQGAQYTGMAREAALYFEEVRASVEYADASLRGSYPKLLSQYIYPPAAFTDEERRRQDEELTATHVAQPAVGAVSAGLLDLLKRLGLKPSMACGHSYGEFTALYAAGALSRDEFVRLSETRGRVMTAACDLGGTMAAVAAPREEVAALLAGTGSVVVANHNAPRQTVISGAKAEVEAAVRRLKAGGLTCNLLPVAGPFHSPLMGSASAPLAESIAACAWRSPSIPVYSNVTARPYESDVELLREQLSRHLLSVVEFVAQIEGVYADGGRVFVEVGPKNILTGLVNKILAGRPHLAVALDGDGGLRGLLKAVGRLFAHGVGLNLPALFDGRDVRQLDLGRLAETCARQAVPPSAWMLDGAGARPQSGSSTHCGKLPFLTRDDAERAAASAPAAPTHVAPPPEAPSHAPTSRAEAAEPSTHAPAPGAPPAGGQVVAAYQAYQETMRQFLSLQEEALKQFLGLQQQQPSAPQGAPVVGAAEFVRPGEFEADVAAASRTNGRRDGGAHAASPTPEAAAPGANGAAASEARGAREPQSASGSTTEARPAAAAGPSAATAEESINRASLSKTLVRIVGERTGYPEEMLGLELDMEAELGVDSIKRIEILEELQRALPAALASKMQESVERLTRVKTLTELLAALMGWVEQAPAAAPPPAAPAVKPPPEPAETRRAEETAPFVGRAAPPVEQSAPPAEQTAHVVEQRTAPAGQAAASVFEEQLTDVACPRAVLRPVAEPLNATGAQGFGGLFVIAEDRSHVAGHVAEALRARGARAEVMCQETLASPAEIERAIAALRREHGPVRGVVHLAALSADELPEGQAEWRRITQVQSKSLYQILRACAAGGDEERPRHVLSASLLGGLFGRGPSAGPGLPTGGSACGMLKTLEEEWPGVVAKAVDFDASLAPAEVAARVVEELAAPAGRLEVGYPSGRRTVFHTVPAPLNADAAEPRLRAASGWVVLATGGARGITAEVAHALAARGMKMTLVGRSPLDAEEPAGTAGVHDVSQLRRILSARNGGPPPTPAQVEAELRSLLRRREARRNLARLEGAGVEVEYRALDVRDASAFAALIDEMYARHGRIDAVLHGAGVIEDKLLKDKSPDSFDRVFDTKADSAFVLARRLRPGSLKLVALFSSVAGRHGNRGQSDYAAANELLNRFAWRMSRDFPAARVAAFNWGPWASSGMASEAVNRQFRERGIIPIGTGAGCRFFMDEIMYGGAGDVEVVAGEGPWLGGAGGEGAYDLGSLLLEINELSENYWMM